MFSVITVNLNSGDKLRKTYASLLNQQIEWEFLIVDGLSRDGSLEIAQNIAESDSRIRVISEPDCGVYDAMNKGLTIARGEFLYFLGAGDEMINGSLVAVAKYLTLEHPALFYGNVITNGKAYDGPFNSYKLLFQNICQQSIIYTASVFRMCGTFNNKYKSHADWDFNFRCFGNGAIKKQFIPVDVAYFEQGGISSRGDAEFEKDKADLIRKHLGWRMYLAAKSRQLKTSIRRRWI